MERDLLLSFVGNHDPVQKPKGDPGPVLSLLQARRFDNVVLLISGPDHAERAQVIRAVTGEHDPSIKFTFVDIRIESVIDYEELYDAMSATLARLEESIGLSEFNLHVLLDPGTPQMQTIWFLLVHAKVLGARLLQGIPARFGGGVYRYREVHVDPKRFPITVSFAATDTARAAPDTTDTSHDKAVRRSRLPQLKTTAEGSWIAMHRTIIAESPAMRAVLELITRVAPFDETVLITGETGTGKELIARSLHEHSHPSGPFISINCAAIAHGLVESELFGHTTGAFTGATAERLGAFRAAHDGTLLLDEVGELPLETQARLLRVLEEKEVTPVGADRPLAVAVRVVAATNRNLHAMVTEGRFRADLYERLRAIPIEIPPLRERGDDIRLLAEHFVREWQTRHGGTRRLSDDAAALLSAYRWPRNVRQLSNVVNRILTFATEEVISIEAIQEALEREESPGGVLGADRSRKAPLTDPERWTGTVPVDLPEILRSCEQRWYATAIRHAGDNLAEAARLIGVNPPAFRKAIRDRFPELRR